MSVELQVIQASEFIRLGADKYLDLEATKDSLRALAEACCKRGLKCALIDLRSLPVQAKPHFNTAELAALVGVFREAGFSKQQRLAILYRHDVHGGIRSFAFIGRMRGLQVHAFSDYEDAIQWLSSEPVQRDFSAEEGVQVPVKQSRPRPKRLPVSAPVHRSTRRISSRQ